MKMTKFTEEQVLAASLSQVWGDKTVEKVSKIGNFGSHIFQVEKAVWQHAHFRSQMFAGFGIQEYPAQEAFISTLVKSWTQFRMCYRQP